TRSRSSTSLVSKRPATIAPQHSTPLASAPRSCSCTHLGASIRFPPLAPSPWPRRPHRPFSAGPSRARSAASRMSLKMPAARARSMRAPGARSAASTPGRTVPNLSRGSINSPDIAANLGVAELELRQYSAAATHLAYALENLLPSTSVDQKAALEASFQPALQHVAVLALSLQPQDATLTIDSRPAQPVAGRLYLDPGTRKLLASAQGHQTLQD